MRQVVRVLEVGRFNLELVRAFEAKENSVIGARLGTIFVYAYRSTLSIG